MDTLNRNVVADGSEQAPEYWNRALAHEERCEWGHALENWRRAFGKGLDDVTITLQMAWCLCYAGQVDAGLRSLEKLASDESISAELRGRIEHVRTWLLLRGDRHVEAAAACMTSERLLSTPIIGLPPHKEYLGQPLAGKRLLIVSYGGAGDQIQHCRYLYPLRAAAAQLTVIVHPGLTALLRHNFPEITVATVQAAWMDGSAFTFDYWCTFITLAAHFSFEPHPAGIPQGAYLVCPEEHRRTWRTWVDRHDPTQAWRLGLNWRGKAESDARFHRASSLRDFAPLAQTSNAASFSLNQDPIGEDDALDENVTFPGNAIRDFSDLSGLMHSMDMIVTTCTAQVHLAGALGISTILLLSPKPDSRWGSDHQTALYPSVQIVRASRAGQWDDAIEQALTLIHAARIVASR
ncbi:hypothetical protein [Trinickia acidisoli]|uniref:hypothetical protein n=1 Tax=Trinickia acidisoli TaxID=2767482 RepID=UPI001A8EFC28|nr:hypothetical protein [Trinickia acidisoli]